MDRSAGICQQLSLSLSLRAPANQMLQQAIDRYRSVSSGGGACRWASAPGAATAPPARCPAAASAPPPSSSSATASATSATACCWPPALLYVDYDLRAAVELEIDWPVWLQHWRSRSIVGSDGDDCGLGLCCACIADRGFLLNLAPAGTLAACSWFRRATRWARAGRAAGSPTRVHAWTSGRVR